MGCELLILGVASFYLFSWILQFLKISFSLPLLLLHCQYTSIPISISLYFPYPQNHQLFRSLFFSFFFVIFNALVLSKVHEQSSLPQIEFALFLPCYRSLLKDLLKIFFMDFLRIPLINSQ